MPTPKVVGYHKSYTGTQRLLGAPKAKVGVFTQVSNLPPSPEPHSASGAILDRLPQPPVMWVENEAGEVVRTEKDILGSPGDDGDENWSAVLDQGSTVGHSQSLAVRETLCTNKGPFGSGESTVDFSYPILKYLIETRGWDLNRAAILVSEMCEGCLNVCLQELGEDMEGQDPYATTTFCHYCQIIRPERYAEEIEADPDLGKQAQEAWKRKGALERLVSRVQRAGIHTPIHVADYSYSSTQINVPEDLGSQIKAWARKTIDKADLYDDPDDPTSSGFEDRIHCTLFYGLTSESKSTIQKLRDLVKGYGPIKVILGKVSVFPGGDEKPYDVVKLSVKSKDLQDLHKLIKKEIPNKETYPEYMPHVTLAYVKAGTGKKYENIDKFEDEEFEVEYFVFAPKEDKKRDVVIRTASESTFLRPRQIQPYHGVRSGAHVDALARKMRIRGWVGDPLLVLDFGGQDYRALTGVHRLAAAIKAGHEDEVGEAPTNPASSAFKAWFSGSKVVDKNGNPLMVYHGSPTGGITTFDPTAPAVRPRTGPPGIYFTNSAGAASSYKGRGGSVMSAYLKIKNPLDITADIANGQKHGLSFGDAKREALKGLSSGYDGVIFWGDESNPGEFVVFSPDQVRLVFGDKTRVGAHVTPHQGVGKKEATPPLDAKAIQRSVRSDKAFEILDRTGPKGTDWGCGACWMLARALQKIYGGELYALRSTETGWAEHVVLKIGNEYVDYDGVFTGPQILKKEGSGSGKDLDLVPLSKCDTSRIEGSQGSETGVQELSEFLRVKLLKNKSVGAHLAKLQAPNTPEFNAWFAGSKAVDSNGKPLVLFHGTKSPPSRFAPSRPGVGSTLFGPYTVERYGIFLAEDPELAEEFATQGDEWRGASIMPLYLKAQSPIDLRHELRTVDFNAIEEAYDFHIAFFINKFLPNNGWKLFDKDNGVDPALIIRVFKDIGYDSAILSEDSSGDVSNTTTWVAFDPTQVKSAVGNGGAYDSESEEIVAMSAPIVSGHGSVPTKVTSTLSRTAAKIRWFHGTSSTFWPGIRSQGLIPNPKKRVWEQGKSSPTSKGREPGAHSLESYPGAYVTSSYAKAYSAAGNAVRNFGGDILILSGEAETRSPDARVDEDHFTSPAGYIQQPGLHFDPREFPTQALPFLTGEPYYDVDTAALSWAEDQKIPQMALPSVLPLAKRLIVSETILNGILGIESSYAYFLEKGYWWSRDTKQVYDAAKAKFGVELPSEMVKLAERTYRSDMNALLSKITKYLEKKEQMGSSPSFRFEKIPIGFSGSNFIDGAISFPYQIETVAPVTVLYRKGSTGIEQILRGFETTGGYNYVLLERGKPPISWVNERDIEMLRSSQSGKDPGALIQAFAQYGVDILQELGIQKQEKVASRAIVGSFYSAGEGSSSPDLDEVNALFEKLFKLNYRALLQGEDEQETYELSWSVLFQGGKYKVLGPNRGEHAEVEFPGTDTDPIVGLLHTHPGGQDADLTETDEEVAQEVANRTGLPLLMGVIGTDPYDEEEGPTLVVDEFFPEHPSPGKKAVGSHYQARLTPVVYRGQEAWVAFAHEGLDSEPENKHVGVHR